MNLLKKICVTDSTEPACPVQFVDRWNWPVTKTGITWWNYVQWWGCNLQRHLLRSIYNEDAQKCDNVTYVQYDKIETHFPKSLIILSFRDLEEINKMMGAAWEHLENERDEEQILERWKYVLDLYQEQPHLIDPHLDTILGRPKI